MIVFIPNILDSTDILDQDELTEDVTAAHTETDSTAEDKSVTYPQIHQNQIPPPTNTAISSSMQPQLPQQKDCIGSSSCPPRPHKLMLSKISIKVSEHGDDFVERGDEGVEGGFNEWQLNGGDFNGTAEPSGNTKMTDMLPASMLQQAKVECGESFIIFRPYFMNGMKTNSWTFRFYRQ